MSRGVVVLSTVGGGDDANRIAGSLVEKGLAACVNVIPGVTSVYRWKGEIARDNEWLMVMKTTEDRLEDLRAALVSLHPYEVPEVVAWPITHGHTPYLDWIAASVGDGGRERLE